MKNVVLMGLCLGSAAVASAQIPTKTIAVSTDLTFGQLQQLAAYQEAAKALLETPGVDYVGVQRGTHWPELACGSDCVNAAGEAYPE